MATDPDAAGPNVDRTGIEVLGFDECRELLATTSIGRVAFQVAGDIDILPVNYVMVGHLITIRTAIGEKLGAAVMNEALAFEIDHYDLSSRTGWSVLAKGTGREAPDEDIERLERTGLEPWAGTESRDRWIQIVPHELTGRRIRYRDD
ncbi:MAG: pyridoxamine 5'-phosphate oxidase family protein [Acidimicrobiia bacterium]|nr:pyridoxamine 5'-phosphate oxidase family protein [Acidimicrobiia bacterium]